MEGNYSLSDLATVTGGNGFGMGGSWLVLIVLFLLIGGNGWNRGGDYGQYATAASQQEILFNQHFNNLDNKMDRGFTSIGNGISDATYALNNTIVGESRGIVGQLYDVKTAVHAEGEATRAMLQQNKIESLQAQVSQLQLAQQMCGVVRYPMQSTYTVPGNPFCNCNSGCGCGNI